ncbi:hypothetical protein D2T31_21290 [Sinirhodobacter populi]|uniref:Uncharacterized protein n=1 Tax=Paenirhodobacter populi TaxID=2306993 RepID=A0A443JZZ2_9RHOB|nr:hypothetical protein D2T31_21290 [Sinirhodobacter populi]
MPWRSMRGMRNRIAQGYLDVDLRVGPPKQSFHRLSSARASCPATRFPGFSHSSSALRWTP